MTTKKKLFVVMVGLVGGAITFATLTDSVSPNDRPAVTVASVMAALTVASLVSLFRHRIHPSNAPPSGRPGVLAAVGSVMGVIAAMLVPRSSLDPVVLGAITGGLLLVVHWSPALDRDRPSEKQG